MAREKPPGGWWIPPPSPGWNRVTADSLSLFVFYLLACPMKQTTEEKCVWCALRDSCQQDNRSDSSDSEVYLSITNSQTETRPSTISANHLRCEQLIAMLDFLKSLRFSCQSQQVSWDIWEPDRSVANLSKQAIFISRKAILLEV